jgi:hypothetical protein
MIAKTISIISFFFVLIPFLTYILLRRKIAHNNYPFYYFIFLITFTDLARGFFLLSHLGNNAGAYFSNINTLVESCFITWMFKQWGIFERKKAIYWITVLSMIIIWSLETLLNGSIAKGQYLSSAVYCLAGTLQTLILTNRIVKTEKKNVIDNPLFIICIGFIFFDIFAIITSVFSMEFLKPSKAFYWNVRIISDLGVTISYFIFSYALVLMTKQHTCKSSPAHVTHFKQLEFSENG